MKVLRDAELLMERPPKTGFTGDVRIGGYFRRHAPSRLAGAVVQFEPGARTPWKVNPVGQTLVILSGRGLTQTAGEPPIELQAGDIVWCEPGLRHWDGAMADTALRYLALQEEAGAGVSFVGAVSEAECEAALGDVEAQIRGSHA